MQRVIREKPTGGKGFESFMPVLFTIITETSSGYCLFLPLLKTEILLHVYMLSLSLVFVLAGCDPAIKNRSAPDIRSRHSARTVVCSRSVRAVRVTALEGCASPSLFFPPLSL